VLQLLHPDEFGVDRFNTLLKHPATVAAIKSDKSLREIRQSWQPALNQFLLRRQQFLIYDGAAM
jgi:uncharacterized protein YbbC (DUF1343 family)